MPNTRIVQTSFTAGELDDRLRARIDIDHYRKGVERARNVLAVPHGGLSKRVGTEYVASTESGTKRLLKFEFSTDQTYLFVLEPLKLSIYRDGILETDINGTGNDYLVTPWTEAEIDNVDYVQSADTMILVHEDVEPIRITRGNSHSTWTIDTITQAIQPTYDFGENPYVNAKFTIPSGGDYGIRTITCDTDVFTAKHVDGSFRTSEGFARIISVTDAKTAELDILKDLDTVINEGDVDPTTTLWSSTANYIINDLVVYSRKEYTCIQAIPDGRTEEPDGDDTHWTATGRELDGAEFSGAVVSLEEPAFSAIKGYPRSVTFFGGRLYYGGSRSLPQTVWGSVVGDFFNFELGEGLADESVQFTLDTNQVNAITHLASARHLQVFTSGSEFYLRTTEGGPVTPSNFEATRVESYGSNRAIKPVTIEEQTLYIDRNNNHLRSFFYDFSQDSYANDVTSLLAPKLIRNPVDIDAFSRFGVEEGNYVLVVNDDGTLAVLNTLVTEGIKSWTLLEFTGGIKVIGVREVEERVYIMVTGLETGKDTLLAFKSGIYTDASISLTDTTTAITGLDHLNGHTVKVVADGSILSDQLVVDGAITVERAATNLTIGLPYEVTVRLMPAVTDDGTGFPGQLESKRITQVEVWVAKDTLGLFVDGKRIPDRKFGNNVLGKAPANGDEVRRVPMLGYHRIANVELSQTDPLPLYILGVTTQLYI